MGLLLYINPSGLQTLPLQPSYPRQWPWTQMVNRVLPGQLDPFHYTLKCEHINDILKLPPNTKSFGDVAEERANSMKAFDSPIYIMYSGGIDSSAAVVAFLRTWSPQELERVHILASHHSADEFPELWNVIVDKFRGRIHPSFRHPEFYCERGYLVTGEHGDQIFGSDVIKHVVHLFEDEGILKPWQETMPDVYRKIFDQEFDTTTFISRYEQTLSACPFPIKTSFDWIWWFNFTNKWQHVKYRLLGHKTWNNPQKSFERVKHFYDTPAWQRWSLDNHDKKIGSTFQSYKLAAKAYIVSSTGFNEYFNKPKIGSLFQIWRIVEFYDAVDDSFHFLERAEALRYVR